MKLTKILAAAAIATVGVTALGSANPAQACSRSGFNAEGTTVLPSNHALSPSSNGPIYLDFRSYEMSNGKPKSAGVYPTMLTELARGGDPIDIAFDITFAPISAWIYVESNGKAKLQAGTHGNPARTGPVAEAAFLANEDDCAVPKNQTPDTATY